MNLPEQDVLSRSEIEGPIICKQISMHHEHGSRGRMLQDGGGCRQQPA